MREVMAFCSFFGGRKTSILEEVVVEGHQRAPKVAGAMVVRQIGGAPPCRFVDDVQHIPVQVLAHERDERGRHVGVGVDQRAACLRSSKWPEFGEQGAHRVVCRQEYRGDRRFASAIAARTGRGACGMLRLC